MLVKQARVCPMTWAKAVGHIVGKEHSKAGEWYDHLTEWSEDPKARRRDELFFSGGGSGS